MEVIGQSRTLLYPVEPANAAQSCKLEIVDLVASALPGYNAIKSYP